MRHGDYDEAELEHQLNNRGFMNRFYKRATSAVTKPWQMYPIGLLFGLGFDTATEVALLATAGAAAAGGLPIYAILCLPILFAAGMSLLDTIDGAFMNFAYGWAFAKPVRKLFYNITITWLSVVVALVIGTIELMSVLAEKLGLTGQPWDFVAGLDLNYVGLRDRRRVRADLGRRAGGLAPRPRSRRSGRPGWRRSSGSRDDRDRPRPARGRETHSEGSPMSVADSPEPASVPAPIASPGELLPYFVFGGLVLLILVYFVGAEEGALSLVSGSSIHELVHDPRHLFGFPCH